MFGANVGNFVSGLSGAMYGSLRNGAAMVNGDWFDGGSHYLYFNASRNWSGSTSSATPNTESLGYATPLSIAPQYIDIKIWKRLS